MKGASLKPFRLVLRLHGDNQVAFHAFAGVPVVTRLAIQGVRAGATEIAIVGEPQQLAAANAVVAGDPRFSDVRIYLGESPATSLPCVEARGNEVLSACVFRLLAAVDEGYVPGAPTVRKGPSGPVDPIWNGEPPPGCFAIALGHSGDRKAKQLLLDEARSPSTGFVSERINAKFSTPITDLLVETPLSPNHVTIAHTSLSLFGALLLSFGDLALLALGGLSMQLASVLDRCDGEVARMKLCESERGAWFDTFCDHIGSVFHVVGICVGYLRFVPATQVPWADTAQLLAIATIAMTALLVGGMFAYLHVKRLGGYMQHLVTSFRHVDEAPGLPFQVLDRLSVFGRRAQYLFGFAVLAFLPWATGNTAFYHLTFFLTLAFVALANLYVILGFMRVHRRNGWNDSIGPSSDRAVQSLPSKSFVDRKHRRAGTAPTSRW